VSQFSSFPVVRKVQWLGCFSALNFAGIQQSFSIFIGWGGPAATGVWHLNVPPHPWRRAWGRAEVPKTPGSGCGVCGGGYGTTKADYVDKTILQYEPGLTETTKQCVSE